MGETTFSSDLNPAVWLEMAKGVGGHGGPRWELGECIWSPSDAQWGGYWILTEPAVGDRIIHCFQGVICGFSRVAARCRRVNYGPPNPGRWRGMAPYFRIELTGYRPFPTAIPLKAFKELFGKDLKEEIANQKPKRYPFVLVPIHGSTEKRIATAQGRLITRVTPNLLQLFCKALAIDADLIMSGGQAQPLRLGPIAC